MEVAYDVSKRFTLSTSDKEDKPGRGRPTVTLVNCVTAPVVVKPRSTINARCEVSER